MPLNSRGMEPRLERAIRRGLLLYEAFVSGRDTAANERQQFGKSELGKARSEHMFSASPPKADIAPRGPHVRFVPTADKRLLHSTDHQKLRTTSIRTKTTGRVPIV